jgi:hypothetical protein
MDYLEENCLFRSPEEWTAELKEIIEKYDTIECDRGLNYVDLKNMLEETEAVGYTFEYYLDAEPYYMRKI